VTLKSGAKNTQPPTGISATTTQEPRADTNSPGPQPSADTIAADQRLAIADSGTNSLADLAPQQRAEKGIISLDDLTPEEQEELGMSFYSQGAHDVAFEPLRRAATLGRAQAQYFLGKILKTGEGAHTNAAEAVKWFDKSVRRGYLPAFSELGVAYYCGKGTVRNYAEAARLFRVAAEHGEPVAQACLASCLEHGDGLEKDGREADKWYRRSAEQGCAFGEDLFARRLSRRAWDTVQETFWAGRRTGKSPVTLMDYARDGLASDLAMQVAGPKAKEDDTESCKWLELTDRQGYLAPRVSGTGLPEVSGKMRGPWPTKERRFEDVVKDAQDAAALVLVY